MIYELMLETRSRTTLLDVTAEVARVVRESGVQSGVCHLYVPHTTAAVTINENADPSVQKDILAELNKAIPFDNHYSHTEGNAAAHIKSSLLGPAQIVFIEDGNLVLGTWQGIYFCEFDGPRHRKLLIKLTGT